VSLLLFSDYILPTTNKICFGGDMGARDELVLNSNKDYVFKITPDVSGTKVNFKLSFYDGGFDN
jgi:hypothetical protein